APYKFSGVGGNGCYFTSVFIGQVSPLVQTTVTLTNTTSGVVSFRLDLNAPDSYGQKLSGQIDGKAFSVATGIMMKFVPSGRTKTVLLSSIPGESAENAR